MSYLKRLYHAWTHRHLNIETPLKTMTVIDIYEDDINGSMVLLEWKHDGQTEFLRLRMNMKTPLKIGDVKQVQTYRYIVLDKKAV